MILPEITYEDIVKRNLYRIDIAKPINIVLVLTLSISFLLTPLFNYSIIYIILFTLIHLGMFFLYNITIHKDKKKNTLILIDWIEVVSDKFAELGYFEDQHEKAIFKRNLESLHLFELVNEYKYFMIAMGSIFEFLLTRYCKMYSIKPEDYITPKGEIVPSKRKHLVNYIQAAIIKNLFNQKNTWLIVQNNLRNFRNYVHIRNEIKEELIDSSWYKTIKPIYFRLVRNMIDKKYYQ